LLPRNDVKVLRIGRNSINLFPAEDAKFRLFFLRISAKSAGKKKENNNAKD